MPPSKNNSWRSGAAGNIYCVHHLIDQAVAVLRRPRYDLRSSISAAFNKARVLTAAMIQGRASKIPQCKYSQSKSQFCFFYVPSGIAFLLQLRIVSLIQPASPPVRVIYCTRLKYLYRQSTKDPSFVYCIRSIETCITHHSTLPGPIATLAVLSLAVSSYHLARPYYRISSRKFHWGGKRPEHRSGRIDSNIRNGQPHGFSYSSIPWSKGHREH